MRLNLGLVAAFPNPTLKEVFTEFFVFVLSVLREGRDPIGESPKGGKDTAFLHCSIRQLG